jgi:hypothetical protein
MKDGNAALMIAIGVVIAGFALTMPAEISKEHYMCDGGFDSGEIVTDESECDGYAEPIGERKVPNDNRLPMFGAGTGAVLLGGFLFGGDENENG